MLDVPTGADAMLAWGGLDEAQGRRRNGRVLRTDPTLLRTRI